MHAAAQRFRGGRATVTLPGYSITEYVITVSGLTHAAAALASAAATSTAALPVPATSGGRADGFLLATGYAGRKVSDGWRATG